LGQGAVVLTALLWSTSGLFIKLLDWHPVIISSLRSLVAFFFMLGVRLLFPPRWQEKSSPGPLWAGGILYALTMILFVMANKLTTSANAILLQYSAPVWAALLGWVFLGERPHWEHWAALVLVFGGLLLFFQGGIAGGSLLGDSIALLSGITFGANSVALRRMKQGNPRDALLLAQGINILFCIPFLFLSPPVFHVPAVLSLLFMGIVQIGCASLLFAYGIKRIPAVQAMLTAVVEPLLNPLWVFLATGEKPQSNALLGGGIIIAAVVGSSIVGKGRGQKKGGPSGPPP